MFRFGAVLVGLVAMAGGLLYAKQESLLYLPSVKGQIPRHNQENPQGLRSPTERGVEQWFDVRIPTADGIWIHAWYLIHPSAFEKQQTQQVAKLPTILFFHGNAGNIGIRLPNAVQMMRHLKCHILLVDYRGYGDSDDTKPPTEEGLKLDAQAAYEWISAIGSPSAARSPTVPAAEVKASNSQLEKLSLAHFVDTAKLYVFGRSLGGAVAFSLVDYVVHHRRGKLPPIAGLMVENTFLNISAMVDRIFPFLKAIKPFVLRLDWNSHKIARTLIETPILYLAGAKDDLVPHHHMQTLYQTSLVEAGNTRAQMHVIPNGTHNESWYMGGMDYWNAIRQFMSQPPPLQSQTSSLSSSARAIDKKIS